MVALTGIVGVCGACAAVIALNSVAGLAAGTVMLWAYPVVFSVSARVKRKRHPCRLAVFGPP